MKSLVGKLALIATFAISGLTGCDESRFDAPTGTAANDRGDEPSFAEAGDGGALDASPAEVRSDLPEGVPGGHFDLDTSTTNYPLNAGQTDHHVHEYDDKYQVNGVDFFNILDPKFSNVQAAIGANEEFRITIGNAQLSPGGMIIVNGKAYAVADWVAQQATKSFSLDGNSGTKLTSLGLVFNAAEDISKQLIGTETGKVVSNTPGPKGEYRNGALTVQLIKTSGFTLDPVLGVAPVGSPAFLWEATLFHHIKQ